jgi:hypothetical protein
VERRVQATIAEDEEPTMAAYDPIPPAIKNADVQLDGDLVRVRWFTEGIPSGPGTLEWLAEVSVANSLEYRLGVKTVDGVGSSWVDVLSSGEAPEQVAEPGELELSEMGVGTQFPLSSLPKVDSSATYRAMLKIDGKQVDVFPQGGGSRQVLTLTD